MKLLKCNLCSLVFDSRIWEQGSDLMSEKEWFESDVPTQLSRWVRVFEWFNNRRTYARIAPLIPVGGSVLEIGVGNGSFLAYVQRKGLSPEGCDLSRTVCRTMKQRTGIPVFHGHLADLPKKKSFDAVVMNHVLEHVCSPVKFIRDVRARLKENGILHIAVPNVACWEAHFGAWNGYEPYHFTYFSPTTLAFAVEQEGFSVIREETRDSFSGWFLVGVRSAFRNRNRSPQSLSELRKVKRDSWMEHCYRSAMVLSGAVTFPTRYFQSRIGHGDEAIVLCRLATSEI